MSQRTITRRTQERIHRLAYDLEYLAHRARKDGLDTLANSFKDMARDCGNLARSGREIWGFDP